MESRWIELSKSFNISDDAPRRLEPNEIEFLLENLPSVKCSDKEARNVANSSLRKFLKEELTGVYLAPSQMSEFAQILRNKFEEARVVASESVGISTADALGESSTQVALNTFHVGGAATAALVGIEGLKSLIFAYQPKNKSTILHLNYPTRSFDETLATRKHLEGISIGDLIDMDNFEIDTLEELGEPYWYKFYFDIMKYPRFTFTDKTMILTIPLKLDKLLYYQISMDELHKSISSLSYGSYTNPIVNIIYSPLHVATIDLHLIPGKIFADNEGLQTFAERSFFRHTVIPVFENVYIRGIAAIGKVYPVSYSVWEKSFSMVRPLYTDEIDRAKLIFPHAKSIDSIWYVKLDRILMEKSGITQDELEGLLGNLGLEFKIYDDDIMYVYKSFFSEGDLSSFIRERKSGLPYIKDQDVIVTKKNKHISNANIRFYKQSDDYFIKYDPKYIKYVLFHMRKQGFKWDLSDFILLWRNIKYDADEGRSVEILDVDEMAESSADQVKAFKLTEYPRWLERYGDLDSDEITDHITYYTINDFKRAFFLSHNFETYIYFDSRFKDEILFHLQRENYVWKDNPISFNIKSNIDISLIDRGSNAVGDRSYLNIRAIHRRKLRKLLEERNITWGEYITFDISIETKIKYEKADGPGDIKLYLLELPPKVLDKIDKEIRKSEELGEKVYEDYVNRNYDAISPEDTSDIDNLIMTVITKHVRKITSSKFYDHWFLTTKDKTSKKFNIYDTLSNPYVDSTRTYNNNLSEIAAVFGVEAAYSYFIKALKDLNAASGNYIDPRHILMIADFIFSRGKPNGVLFAGLSRQPIGHISLITVERAMEVLRKLAFTKSTENINSVSNAISTGQLTPLGTGMLMFSDNPKIQKQIYQFTKNTKDIIIGSSEVSKEINDLHKGTLNNYEPEREPAAPDYVYKIGTVYATLQALFQDVLESTQSPELGFSENYVENVLPMPNFSISHMELPPNDITVLLSQPVPKLIKKEYPAPKPIRSVTLNAKPIKEQKRSAEIILIAGLPKLNPQIVLHPSPILIGESEYIDIDKFLEN